ncbi:MAG: hypothetical protein NZM12_01155, partial [Steroidobacteraceae bacterium]|nr:hypothetical protein [Steroidobacteraceae bacterium]
MSNLTRPEVLGELLAIAIALVLAAISSRFVDRWHRRHGQRLASNGWRARTLEGTVVLLPYGIALALLLGIRWVLVRLDSDIAMLDIAIKLVGALVIVRAGVFAVRLMVGPGSWVQAWEGRLTL